MSKEDPTIQEIWDTIPDDVKKQAYDQIYKFIGDNEFTEREKKDLFMIRSFLSHQNNTNKIPQFIFMPKSLYYNLPFDCKELKSILIDNDTVVVSGPEMIEKIMDLNKKGEL